MFTGIIETVGLISNLEKFKSLLEKKKYKNIHKVIERTNSIKGILKEIKN